MADYDLLIRGGTVSTATDTFSADIGLREGKIAAIGDRLGMGQSEIDATGRLVLPGGVDPHCHIEQLSSSGLPTCDDWESATKSALFGGTTTVIAFIAQHRGMDLAAVAADYASRAGVGALADYALHNLVADPTETTLKEHLPTLIQRGHSSIKFFMTYDRLRIDDEQALDLLLVGRKHRAMVCVHAENTGMIAWASRRLIERGYTQPKYHAVSHPRLSEAEAIYRLICMAAIIDQPVMVFHVSTAEGVDVIRHARGRGLKVFAETCPHYLFLTRDDLDKPGVEGTKWICSPPLREARDQEALWQGLAEGVLQVVSSDHAPYAFDKTGKLSAGAEPTFKQVPNGMPGAELRLPVMFDAMVSKGRLGVRKFVEVTSTAPASIYNLAPRKGSIVVGGDADVAIWNPAREVVIEDALMHDRTGYTPFTGRRIRGWPEIVIRRGEVVVEHGSLKGHPGSGELLLRDGGWAAEPASLGNPDLDPDRNFGVPLL